MESRLIRYYKKKIYGGRSFLARTIDFIILRIVVLFVIFLTILYFSHSIKTALLIAVFVTLAISFTLVLIRRRKIKRYIEDDLVRIKQKCLLEELTLKNDEEYIDYMGRLFDGFSEIRKREDGFLAQKNGACYYVLHNHPSSVCDIDMVLKIRREFSRQNLNIISLSDFNEAAKTFCNGQGIKLISGKSILKSASEKNMLSNEETAKQNARQEMYDSIVTFDKLKSSAFSKTKVKAYIFCGLAIMCWPLVTGFRIYYPIIAVICFVMAAITFRINKSHEESHDIGIT